MNSKPHQPAAENSLRQIYDQVEYLSIKHSSYFSVYETLFSRFQEKALTFVEIGVLNGGSLFMWREYFGPKARIIGIDLNPAAKKWESFGFEIFIGDQLDVNFWREFFAQVGKADIVLDDGGHTNAQQIVTLASCIDNIKDGGLFVVEDVHCSYMTNFGNPSGYSFISFAKRLIDQINARNPLVPSGRCSNSRLVYSIRFFESIVALDINRSMCGAVTSTTNGGMSSGAVDFRYNDRLTTAVQELDRKLSYFAKVPLLWRVTTITPHLLGLIARIKSRQSKHLF